MYFYFFDDLLYQNLWNDVPKLLPQLLSGIKWATPQIHIPPVAIVGCFILWIFKIPVEPLHHKLALLVFVHLFERCGRNAKLRAIL